VLSSHDFAVIRVGVGRDVSTTHGFQWKIDNPGVVNAGTKKQVATEAAVRGRPLRCCVGLLPLASRDFSFVFYREGEEYI
jgi:hypothetical protein